MSRIAEALLPSPYRDGAPGYKEGTTSRLAAAQVREVDNVRCLVLQTIRAMPRTADEVAKALDISILTVRPRCSELRGMMAIRPRLRPNGKQERRKNASGASAIVWEVDTEASDGMDR